MIRVLVADDHPVVREGMRRLMSETPDIRVVDEAATGDEVIECLGRTLARVALLDVSMPGPGIVGVLEQVRRRRPDIAALVLSMYPEDQYALRVLRAGAAGYINKDQPGDRLLDAVRLVAGGRKYVTPSLAERLADEVTRGPGRSAVEVLSEREYEVLRQIVSGRSLKEIAAAMGLSPKTVSTYRTRLLEKLHLRGNAELVRFAVEHELPL